MRFRYITPRGNENNHEHWLCPDAFGGLAFKIQESHQGESKLQLLKHLGCEGDILRLTTLRYSEND